MSTKITLPVAHKLWLVRVDPRSDRKVPDISFAPVVAVRVDGALEAVDKFKKDLRVLPGAEFLALTWDDDGDHEVVAVSPHTAEPNGYLAVTDSQDVRDMHVWMELGRQWLELNIECDPEGDPGEADELPFGVKEGAT